MGMWDWRSLFVSEFRKAFCYQAKAYLGIGNGNVVLILIPYALAFYKSYNSYPELLSICNILFSMKAFRSNFSVPNSWDPNQ